LKLEVILSNQNEAYIIKNLYPLYLYDLGNKQNRHGIFEESDDIKTLTEQYDMQNTWWSAPSSLYPYLILADGLPVGFVLVASPPYCSTGIDYLLHEMFLLKSFRGSGLAEQVVVTVIDKLHGKWELTTRGRSENIISQKFWRRTLNNYTQGNFTEELGIRDSEKQLIFRFVN
jgi:aminoglycoside 6'-N-acetyltransferase I